MRPDRSPSVAIMDKESAAASIDRVATKIPPFWARDPELWFRQVESQFALSGITNDDTKFHYVTGNLDARYAEDVRDILVDPPETGKYQLLKTELIRRLGTSQEKKTRQLLEQEEMGDRKPSQFLRHLRGLAGTAVPDELLKTIWLGRIPASMRVILVTQTEAGLDKMAEFADAVSDALPERHQVAAVSTDSFETMLERLTIHITTKMGELANGLRQEIAAVEDRVSARGSRSRERRSPSRQRARSRGRGKDGVCWYHWRFGADATRCEPPCNFRSGNDQGGH